MRIVMLRPVYKPEHSAGNHLAEDLIKDLQECGHEVILITGVKNETNVLADHVDECRTIRVVSRFRGSTIVQRALWNFESSIRMIRALRQVDDVDLVISHSMPLTLGLMAALAGKRRRIPIIYWEQDLVSESMLSSHMSSFDLVNRLAYSVLKSIERITLKYSTTTITISERFRSIHRGRQKATSEPLRIEVIRNWIDSDRIYPVPRSGNPLFTKYGLDPSKFYVTYCGNFGVPQNIEIIIDAAKLAEEESQIEFILVGGGYREKEVEAYYNEVRPKNLRILPLQPIDQAKFVYSVGDVGLVTGRSGTSRNGFPSKALSIMAAGQAVLSSFDVDSELAHMIKESDAGRTVPPDNGFALYEAIISLYRNPEMVKRFQGNGRRYIEENCSRHASTRAFIEVIERGMDDV